MAVPQEIIDLVERFERDRDIYQSDKYNEAQLRKEFIDPFFKALGWDMDNTKGYAPAYREVIHEDAIKVGGFTKAPDYCFRIGGSRKFFLEAKKPSVNLKDDINPSFQLRRYAWSAKLPLSILTDFEEFAVYDCRIKPIKNDKSSTARTIYMKFDKYADRWDEIASIFAREAILKGSFDRYVETAGKKRGTAEVDAAFLKEIESWREILAKNIALRNPALTTRELNYAVQQTIDRIIFLRICEDRGIEEYGKLLSNLNGNQVYKRLIKLFHDADARYNSGLFHFEKEKDRPEDPDELTLKLNIDDKPLKAIIKDLYYPDSPYEFSVLPADILGQVYEQFLGKVIRLTAGHHAVIDDKPEVKKAGGVYYTPTYIVDYIVKNTIGKLLEGKKSAQAAKLKILDPACGSGSFLIGAYQYLLDWHRNWYTDNDPKKYAKKGILYEGPGGDWRLSTSEKKRILLNNIYGVDIDSQAVEVTKLSLLLKVLEDETQLSLFKERALPDLGNNIKCGNSLIGHDFYEGQQIGMFDEEERYGINAFDWNTEFPEIMKSGGFDAVIGNPPYVRVRAYRDLHNISEVTYLEKNYECATHVWDIYMLIFEKAIRLLRKHGFASFIVPIQTLHQPNCESLRRILIRESSIIEMVDLAALRVFEKAIVKNCILVARKSIKQENEIEVRCPNTLTDLVAPPIARITQVKVVENPGYSLKTDLLTPKRDLCEKLRKQSYQLNQLCYVTFGLRSCAKGKGQGGKDRLITDEDSFPESKPYLEGRDIKRYIIRPTGKFIRYLPSEMYSPREPRLFETRKLIAQSMLSKMQLVATIDEFNYFVEQSLVCIVPHGILTSPSHFRIPSLEFLLGIINSRLETFYYKSYIIDYSLGGGLIHATPGSLGKLIIPRTEIKKEEQISELVKNILELNKQSFLTKTPNEKTTIQRQIAAIDHQIDQLVYELYGLTEEEIKIVEGSA